MKYGFCYIFTFEYDFWVSKGSVVFSTHFNGLKLCCIYKFVTHVVWLKYIEKLHLLWRSSFAQRALNFSQANHMQVFTSIYHKNLWIWVTSFLRIFSKKCVTALCSCYNCTPGYYNFQEHFFLFRAKSSSEAAAAAALIAQGEANAITVVIQPSLWLSHSAKTRFPSNSAADKLHRAREQGL